VEDFGADLQGVAETFGARGDDHELLEVHVVVGVRAAVEDVHHRDGERARAGAPEVAVERHFEVGRARARRGQRDGEQGVGAELRLVFGAVERQQRGVDLGLVERVHAFEFRPD
jgi:hypothetical protein